MAAVNASEGRYKELLEVQQEYLWCLHVAITGLGGVICKHVQAVEPLTRTQIFDIMCQVRHVANMGRELEIRSEELPALLTQLGAERSRAASEEAPVAPPPSPSTLEPGMAAAAAPQEAPIKTPPAKRRRSTR
mgnify:FL=1